MRKKENQCGEVNAFFYNFVSMETNEGKYIYYIILVYTQYFN